ncbi:hypothetical protein [Nitrosomonas sp.]|uniref:hypothetical protein n=1 Tax=Nitrosomonas sp. TaxID=42353 RepID=UPI001DD0FF90|nr:hypothetical protein [Nitrosomonas sp.]MBX3616591.1 hypothetical protein [Nitrosomonas sp.]
MSSRIAALSLTAIRMAATGPCEETAVIARWLYRFGIAPCGPAIERDFGPDDDPMAILGLTKGAHVRRQLETAYDAHALAGWYSFARTALPEQISTACKLYVSPKPEALSDAFPVIAEQFTRNEVRSFKVGRGIEGLLRPDKIVAYFDSESHMMRVATALDKSLQGCPAQGVPFTAEIAGNGLVSSGIDPPVNASAISWRSWITKRLAASLAASFPGESAHRTAIALTDLRNSGIDPDRWAPIVEHFWTLSPS